jgi:Spy/CpxP family protein refolding chaperone
MKVTHPVSLFAAALTLLAISLPIPAFSQMNDMPGRHSREGHGRMMHMGAMDGTGNMAGSCLDHAEKLGLTDNQIMTITPLHRDMQKKQAQFTADAKIAEIELMEIMEVKDFDLDKATAAVRKIEAIQTDRHIAMLQSMKQVRSILTETQFKEMKKMMYAQKMMPRQMIDKKPAMKTPVKK